MVAPVVAPKPRCAAYAPGISVALGEMDAPPKEAPPCPPAGSATSTRPESVSASSQPVGQPVSGEKSTASVGSAVSKDVTCGQATRSASSADGGAQRGEPHLGEAREQLDVGDV